MSEAMGRKPTPFRAVHHTTHRLDPDENGISFPRLLNVRHKRLECDPRTPLDFPRLHGEMLAEIAGGKNASLGESGHTRPWFPIGAPLHSHSGWESYRKCDFSGTRRIASYRASVLSNIGASFDKSSWQQTHGYLPCRWSEVGQRVK